MADPSEATLCQEFMADPSEATMKRLVENWRVPLIGFLSVSPIGIGFSFLFPVRFPGFYSSINSELFNAAFLLAGLLLAIKTYLVVKMEEGVYSKDSYIKRFILMSDEGETEDVSHFDPLERLSDLLDRTIVMLTIAACVQLLDGLIPGPVEPTIGFSMMFGAAVMTVYCWREIRKNLTLYFKFLREDCEERVGKIRKEIDSKEVR